MAAIITLSPFSAVLTICVHKIAKIHYNQYLNFEMAENDSHDLFESNETPPLSEELTQKFLAKFEP